MNSNPPDDDLQRALERLTVQEVWRKAGLPMVPRDGNVVCKSPFREDKKGKSFSICFHGKGWVDFAEDTKGGVWQFSARATGKEGKELADWVIEAAGIKRTVRIADSVARVAAARAGGAVAELPPEVIKAAKRDEKRRELWAAEARLREEREAALRSRFEFRAVFRWSSVVRARFRDGWLALRDDEARMADWAKRRGWPVQWVRWLVSEGLVSAPWLPWDDEGGTYAKRGKAFRVDAPQWEAEGVFAGLMHIGYHQQFWKRDGGKAWVFVPSLPSGGEGAVRGRWQREMVEDELAHGAEWGGVARVPALPFVMVGGWPCRLLVIAEGQWDAITWAGACGWMENEEAWPLGVWVMGLRGAASFDVGLTYWRRLFSSPGLRVLVLADNDEAGRRWTEAKAPERLGALAEPTFTEKLLAAGVERVEVMRIKPAHGKDFNDYYQARKPTAAALLRWLQEKGLWGVTD